MVLLHNVLTERFKRVRIVEPEVDTAFQKFIN